VPGALGSLSLGPSLFCPTSPATLRSLGRSERPGISAILRTWRWEPRTFLAPFSFLLGDRGRLSYQGLVYDTVNSDPGGSLLASRVFLLGATGAGSMLRLLG
jgi:hypothetical protein